MRAAGAGPTRAASRVGRAPTEGRRQRAPTVVAVAVLVALAADGALALRRALRPSQPLPRPLAHGARSDESALAALAAAHLFGTVDAPEAAPETEGGLRLFGTVAVPDARQGLAIVGPTAAGARLYSAGTELPGRFSLEEIYTDRVVVRRDGVARTLYLPHADLTGLFAAAARAPAATNPADSPPPAELARREAAVQREPLYQMAAGEWTFGGLNPRPRLVGGRVVGALLSPRGGDAAALARRAGLRSGDVLVAVDGQPLGSIAQLPSQLRGLEGRQSQLTVRRASGETAIVVLTLPAVDHDDG